MTIAAIKSMPPGELVDRIVKLREDHDRSLSTYPTFGKGSLRRLGEIEDQALAWAK